MSRLVLLIALLATVPQTTFADDLSRHPRLIEFGWDEPDTSFLRTHQKQIDRTPFDGCVFHVDAYDPKGKAVGSLTWQGWGKREFTKDELVKARDDLSASASSSGRSTSHFLRFNTTPADIDWFDDFSAVVANARHAARLARLGKCAGILLDTEQYEGRLFQYERQRDAKSKPWQGYARQARLRGREVMNALQDEFPDIHILLTFGYTLPLYELKGVADPKALAKAENGLLAPFLDGMVDGARGNSRIIDGFELSYGYKTVDRFDLARTRFTETVLPLVADPKKYAQVMELGFGLWLDYKWQDHGWNVADPGKNYFTPDAFAQSVALARKKTSQYVWIYTEQPRWWTPEGKSAKLPVVYETILRKAWSK